MKSTYSILSAILATSVMAVPNVYLAGDSTMALGGGGTGTQGMCFTVPNEMPLTDMLQAGESISHILSKA